MIDKTNTIKQTVKSPKYYVIHHTIVRWVLFLINYHAYGSTVKSVFTLHSENRLTELNEIRETNDVLFVYCRFSDYTGPEVHKR